ncbi:MAG: PQQ-binding-like beta-propeller repeat protein [Phycisphaerae bacterium]|nr:PQQ-binding-like beta-propeller repeat protein [Phycisphaerae bacterium]
MTLFLLFSLCVSGTTQMARDGNAALITFRVIIGESEEVSELEYCFSPDGEKWHKIADFHFSTILRGQQTSFTWVFQAEYWRDGWLKVTARNRHKKFEDDIILRMPSTVNTFFHMRHDTLAIRDNYTIQDQSDTWWPTFRYDAERTANYPLALVAPLEMKWVYSITYNDFVMMSGAAGEDMLYVGDGLGDITSISLESGHIVWHKTLTSNVWTAMLMDTLLFVGTSFEPSLVQPTFFCLDARSGEVKWSDFFWTVEYSPVFVDSFVIVTTFNKLRNYTYSGSLKWERVFSDTTSVQENPPSADANYAYVGGRNCVVQAIDIPSGMTIWQKMTSNWVMSPITVTDSLLIFYTWDSLMCLRKSDGSPKWARVASRKGIRSGIAFDNGSIYCSYSESPFTVSEACVESTGQPWWSVEFDTSEGVGSCGGVRTANGLFWLTNTKKVFALNCDNGILIYDDEELTQYDGYLCWAWPIIYEGNLIAAKGKYLLCLSGSDGTLESRGIKCWPNPFVDECNITIMVKYSGTIRLRCFDVVGRLIWAVDVQDMIPGVYQYHWDGTASDGNSAPPGVYFISYEIEMCEPGVKKVILFSR